MPTDVLPRKRYRKSLVALLLFIAYAVTLFVHNLNVQRRLEQNLIDGCQSRVWVQCDMTEEGHLVFTADSDALKRDIRATVRWLVEQVHPGAPPPAIEPPRRRR